MEANTYVIQAAVSIVTATIVAFITLQISNKKFYEQQWWEKRANKYEEILLILGKLQRIYNELEHQTSDGSNMSLKRYPDFIDLKTKLKIEIATASFYLDKNSTNLLKSIEDRFSDEEEEYGTCPDNYFISDTAEAIRVVVVKIIESAKVELKGKYI